MTHSLPRGGNAVITPTRLWLAVSFAPVPLPSGIELDVSCFLLTEAGKVRTDEDMIFYNQRHSRDGAVGWLDDASAAGGSNERVFRVELGRLAPEVTRLAFTVTLDEGASRGRSLGQLSTLTARVVDADSGQELLRFDQAVAGAQEVAMILAEIYQRSGQWKLRAVGQGFTGGLAPLATHYGVVVDSPPPPPPPPPPPKVSLSKVTLEKKGQSVSLAKQASGFGKIRVNLNWARGTPKPQTGLGSWFGGGGAKGVDLDLGCFVELADGQRGAVQALGKQFGSLREPPFVELSGDDRTGAIAAGEDLYINGDQWHQIRRLLVFAFIYEGASDWDQTDGVVTIHADGQPPLEVRLTHGRKDRPMCAIASLENENGTVKVTKLAEYFSAHPEMDRHYGWGFRWAAGSKD